MNKSLILQLCWIFSNKIIRRYQKNIPRGPNTNIGVFHLSGNLRAASTLSRINRDIIKLKLGSKKNYLTP